MRAQVIRQHPEAQNESREKIIELYLRDRSILDTAARRRQALSEEAAKRYPQAGEFALEALIAYRGTLRDQLQISEEQADALSTKELERRVAADPRPAHRQQERDETRIRRQREYRQGLFAQAGCPKLHVDNLELFEQSTNKRAHAIRDLLVDQAGFSKGYIVALIGPRGTGKTEIAVSVTRECCEGGLTARYTKAAKLFADLQTAFAPVKRGEAGVSESDLFESWVKPDLLTIDETHQVKESEWKHHAFVNLLDDRYGGCKCTILIANQTPEEFAQAVGDSIVSRISECGELIVCDWPSYRVAGNWKQGDGSAKRRRRELRFDY